MKSFLLEVISALLGALLIILVVDRWLPAQSANQNQVVEGRIELMAAIADRLCLQQYPSLSVPNDCQCRLAKGDILEFKGETSQDTFSVRTLDGKFLWAPLYNVKVLQSARENCRNKKGWVFGGLIEPVTQ